jgi:hypothetical protein
MTGLYPLSRMQQFDSNGRRAAVPVRRRHLKLCIGYRDTSLTAPHPNPIVADSAGRLPLIYLDDGFRRHRLTRSHQPSGDAADPAIDRIYHLLTLCFALWPTREIVVIG